jgi:hypothetical protein
MRRAAARRLVVITVAALASAAFAVEIPGPDDLKFRIDLEARFRPEWRTNTDFNDLIDDDQLFVDQRIRVGGGIEKGTVAVYFQAQDVRRWGEEPTTLTDTDNVDLKLGYVDWNDPAGAWMVRAGRQELIYGEERLVGATDWNMFGRSFDGIRFAHTAPSWDLDGFAARIADRGSDESNQDFAGVYATILKPYPAIHLDLYALWLRDGLEQVGEIPAEGIENSSIFTVGFRAFGEASGFSYNVEAAGQAGDSATDDHEAWALATRAGYTFTATCKPHVAVGYDTASGDADPADGESREFENLFPTNHGIYGYMDYLGWRNVEDLYLRVRLEPAAHLVVQADLHDFRLRESSGRWSDAAGNTVLPGIPGGAAGDHLGQEVDLTLKVELKDWKFQAGYSHFFAGEVPEEAQNFVVTNLAGDDSDWGYLMATVKF